MLGHKIFQRLRASAATAAMVRNAPPSGQSPDSRFQWVPVAAKPAAGLTQRAFSRMKCGDKMTFSSPAKSTSTSLERRAAGLEDIWDSIAPGAYLIIYRAEQQPRTNPRGPPAFTTAAGTIFRSTRWNES